MSKPSNNLKSKIDTYEMSISGLFFSQFRPASLASDSFLLTLLDFCSSASKGYMPVQSVAIEEDSASSLFVAGRSPPETVSMVLLICALSNQTRPCRKPKLRPLR